MQRKFTATHQDQKWRKRLHGSGTLPLAARHGAHRRPPTCWGFTLLLHPKPGNPLYPSSRTPQHVAALTAYSEAQATEKPTLHEPFPWSKAGYPVAVIDELDDTRPQQVTLMGEDYVLWKDGGGTWRAFADKCPHRLAPLSEGRVEADGSLLCAYHAWRFDGTGACTAIPQARDKDQELLARNNPRACATAYPTRVEVGVVWMWPEAGAMAELESSLKPINHIAESVEGRSDVWGTFWRSHELPYGLDYFFENVVDDAHVVTSHHNAAGNRYTDAKFFEVEQGRLLTCKEGFSFTIPSGRKGLRQTTSFIPPNLVRLDQFEPDGATTITCLYAVPTKPGYCKHIGRQVFVQGSTGKFPADKNVFGNPYLPLWLLHMLAPAFLHQDQVFLHWQEKIAAHNVYKSQASIDTPILPTSIPGVGLQHTSRFGTSAVAMRDFTAGSLIMAEVPLLCTAALTANDQAAVERLKAKLPHTDTQTLQQVVAFCHADTEVQQKVLNCMYSPFPIAVARTAILEHAAKVAAAVAKDEQLVKAMGAASAFQAEATATKVMLAWQCNAWDYQNDASALFEVGSKLPHTCSTPNTFRRFCDADDLTVPEEVRGKGCHVATRDIAAGELITTTYLHPKLTRQSCLIRQHVLKEGFGFKCECEHCRTGVDRYRGLPCAECSGDARDMRGVISVDVAVGLVASKGMMWCDLGKAAAGNLSPWKCDACGATAADDDRALFGPLGVSLRGNFDSVEVKLLHLIQEWDAAVGAQHVTIKDMTEKWAFVAGMVGPAHWATYHMYGLLAELHAGEVFGYSLQGGAMGRTMVQTYGLEEAVKDMTWHLKEMQEDYDKIWGWMSTPIEAAEAACQPFIRTAKQLLDAAQTNLLPARPASGTSSIQPVMEVQHQLAHLAGVLLRRIGPVLDATRGWYLPHVLLHDWDVLMQRCGHVLALPVMALEEATRLVQESRADSASSFGTPPSART